MEEWKGWGCGNMAAITQVCAGGSLHWCPPLCASAGGIKEATDVSLQLLPNAYFKAVTELS